MAGCGLMLTVSSLLASGVSAMAEVHVIPDAELGLQLEG